MGPPPFRLPYSSMEALRSSMNNDPSHQSGRIVQWRHKFSPAEDQRLQELVAQFGQKNWTAVAAQLGTRSPRQCRERFKNYLSPSLRNEPWTAEQDQLLGDKVRVFGARWSSIIAFFPTRSEVNLKNRWSQIRPDATLPSPPGGSQQRLTGITPTTSRHPPAGLDITRTEMRLPAGEDRDLFDLTRI
jgi:hypothetical protein